MIFESNVAGLLC